MPLSPGCQPGNWKHLSCVLCPARQSGAFFPRKQRGRTGLFARREAPPASCRAQSKDARTLAAAPTFVPRATLLMPRAQLSKHSHCVRRIPRFDEISGFRISHLSHLPACSFRVPPEPTRQLQQPDVRNSQLPCPRSSGWPAGIPTGQPPKHIAANHLGFFRAAPGTWRTPPAPRLREVFHRSVV